MRDLRTLVVVAVAVGLVATAGAAGPATAATTQQSTTTPASVTAQTNGSANDSSVSVGVGQQLSTVIAASEADVGTDVEAAAFEASYERADESGRAEAVADRAETLRERAVDVREDYREATREYENGDISRSEYAQRLAVLNARAENLLASYERLQRRAANVSGFELAAAGMNRTALRTAVRDVESVTGTGPTALLERFTGQRRGEVELERRDGLSIEVESEGGERSREVERPRDDDGGITVQQAAALETARGVLSEQDGRWALEKASVHPESGYHEFEFVLLNGSATGEAEVRVDGSSGEVFRIEEEFEPRDDVRDDGGEDERDDDEGDYDADDGEADEVDELALVVVDGTPAPDATVTVQALADGEPLDNATVRLDGGAVGETGPAGTVDVTLPAGSSELTVAAAGEDAELEFEFERGDDERERGAVFRGIETSTTLDGGTVTLTVTYEGAGVENVTVHADGDRVGRTGADGTVTFATDAGEELEVELVKGELEAELAYRVVDGSLVLAEGAHEGDGDKIGRGEGDEVEDVTLSVVEGEPARGATVTVAVRADGEPAANATVTVDGEPVGQTDADGRLAVTLPDREDVELAATAGGEDAELEFEREDDRETETPEPSGTGDDLSLTVVSGDPAPGATITVEVTADGEPVAGASVSVEGDAVGETGADGTVRVTLPTDEDDPRVRAETDEADGRIEFDFEATETPEPTETGDDDGEAEDDD